VAAGADSRVARTRALPRGAVLSTEAPEGGGIAATFPMTSSDALSVYGTTHAERQFLPPKLQRATLAYLVLPLERHRLLALVQSFETRSRTTGRSIRDEPANDFELEF